MKQRTLRVLVVGTLAVALAFAIAACSGPESSDDSDPTATLVPTEARAPTEEAESTATEEPEVTEEPTDQPTEEPTEPEETATQAVEPTEEPSPTPEPSPTSTVQAIDLEEALPTADDFPNEGFALANQGFLSDLDLANAYSESSEHLERLDDWGFEEHYFREFNGEGSDDESVPSYVLTTGNVYGSPEQAEEAMDWLRRLNSNQGHEFVDPAPDLGDYSIASTVDTADGTPTAIIFVQVRERVYAVFASAGNPLEFVMTVAEKMMERLENPEEGDEDTEEGIPEEDGEEDEDTDAEDDD